MCKHTKSFNLCPLLWITPIKKNKSLGSYESMKWGTYQNSLPLGWERMYDEQNLGAPSIFFIT